MTNLEVAWAIGFSRPGNGTGAAILGDTMFVTGGGRLLGARHGVRLREVEHREFAQHAERRRHRRAQSVALVGRPRRSGR